jgi:hypothetical protein
VREIENPAYSTAVGLVYHGLKHKSDTGMTPPPAKKERSVSGMARKMKEWFDQL